MVFHFKEPSGVAQRDSKGSDSMWHQHLLSPSSQAVIGIRCWGWLITQPTQTTRNHPMSSRALLTGELGSQPPKQRILSSSASSTLCLLELRQMEKLCWWNLFLTATVSPNQSLPFKSQQWLFHLGSGVKDQSTDATVVVSTNGMAVLRASDGWASQGKAAKRHRTSEARMPAAKRFKC